jgi:hypothetical protein
LPCFCDHRSDGEVVRSGARLRSVAVDEQELVDTVRGGREEVPSKAEDVAVPGIDTRDRGIRNAVATRLITPI